MACTSGCKTKDHRSYAECLRAKSTGSWMVAISKGFDQNVQRRWDNELKDYAALRKEGIQPDGTTRPKLEQAKRLSDMVGAAYGRDFNKATAMEDIHG
jgi:hypothetical protein